MGELHQLHLWCTGTGCACGHLYWLQQEVYMPSKSAIWQRYLLKYSKNGQLLETDAGLTE